MDVNKIISKIWNGDFEDVKRFIEENPETVNQKSSDSQTFLMAACEQGSTSLIAFLIESGANMDMSNIGGQTALHYAVKRQQTDAVALLVSSGANVNKQNSWGETPLHRAVVNKYEDVVKVLLNSKENNNLQVNLQNIVGWTVLHYACELGLTNIVELLLKHNGIDVNAVEEDGWTALHVACQEGHTDVVELLLQQNGIDANKVNEFGDTPLHLAVRNQHYDVVASMLAQDSVKLEIENNDKRTPLLEAVSATHIGIVHKMITCGANINAVDKDGNNCLHIAAEKEEFCSEEEHITILDECCEELQLEGDRRLSGIVVGGYLASQGASLYHRNDEKVTPLDCIENQHLKEKLKTFLQSLCWWCQEKKATVTLHPCRHTICCQNCCSQMTFKQCPICRQHIRSKSGFVCPKPEEKAVQTVAESVECSKCKEKVESVESVMVEEKHLHRVSQKLAGKWMELGRELEIKQTDLEIIRHDYSSSIVEQGFQMLLKWWRSTDPEKRTLQILKAALERTECYDALECLSSEFN